MNLWIDAIVRFVKSIILHRYLDSVLSVFYLLLDIPELPSLVYTQKKKWNKKIEQERKRKEHLSCTVANVYNDSFAGYLVFTRLKSSSDRCTLMDRSSSPRWFASQKKLREKETFYRFFLSFLLSYFFSFFK